MIGVAIGTWASAIFKSMYYMVFAGKHILKMKISRLIRDFAVTMVVLIAISCVGMRIVFDIPFYNYWRWCVGGVVTVMVLAVVSLATGYIAYPDIAKSYVVTIKKKLWK